VRRASVFAFATVATLIVPGCGRSGPEMAAVFGKVTYNGKPVPMGTISFQPDAPDGRTAVGEIDSDGSYQLQTENPGDGAQLGSYHVSISAVDAPVLDYIPAKPVPPKRLVPEKYEKPETSGLTATVKSGKNEIPFDLK